MVNDVGTQLGNYRLQRVLGRGGFADVYLGEHIYLRTSAAIKVLRTQLSDDALTQFLTEARTIARLAHSHIVSVLDFGIEREIPFLVMSYAPHGTVRERHPVGSVLPVGTVIAYAKQMAEALQYAHERKVIHRDVKPENMLLGEDERLMLSDFGIALTTQNTAGMVLKPSQDDKVVGTTTYMSPEQFTGTPSLLSDQYALAVVVYEWLSGAPPFVGSDMDIVKQHMYTAPPPLRAKAPHLSEAFEQVVLRALSKEQQDRFPRVMDFTQALEDASGRSQSRSLRQFAAFGDGPLRLSSPLSNSSPLPSFSTETVADFQGRPQLLAKPFLPSKPQQSTPLLPPPPSQQSPSPLQSLLQVGNQKVMNPLMSRRKMMTGLAALGIVGGVGVLGLELLRSTSVKGHPAPTPSPTAAVHVQPTATPTPAPSPTATPTPSPSPFVLVNTRPAVASWGAGQLDVFVRGSNNALWQQHYVNGVGQGWNAVVDNLVNDPAVVAWGPGRYDVFARGTDNSLQHTWYDGTWHPWESLGGTLTSNPAVSSWGAGRLDVFVRSTDNGIWHMAYGGAWSEWESLGGGITSDPAAVSWGANTIDVFARGTDNALWTQHYDGSWHGWGSLGGTLASDPTASSWGANRLDAFALSTSATLMHIYFDGSWHSWEDLGGASISAPAAFSWGVGYVDIYTRASNNYLQHLVYNNGWQPWTQIQ